MPFGIKSAGDICQKRIEQCITENIPVTEPCQDNILITGKTLEEHNDRLEKVLINCKKAGITFNKPKCKFRVKVR